VLVKPRQAQVYVDGYFVGLVDDFDGFAQRLRLVPGEHRITLYLDGYKTITDTLLFRPSASYKIRHEMQHLAPGESNPPRPVPTERERPTARGDQGPMASEPGTVPPRHEGRRRTEAQPGVRAGDFGTVAVRVQPEDATVLIDGERWDSPDRDRLNVQLSPGTHRIEIRKDGYKDYSAEVTVRAGETTRVNVSLPHE
jgi:hypothetical protein